MLRQYRAMSPRERIAEMRALMDIASRALGRLPAEERARRLAVETRLHRESNEALLRGLARQEDGNGAPDGG